MRGHRLFAGALAFALVASAAAEDPAPTADELMRSGKSKLDAGDYKGAAEDFRKAAEAYRKSIPAPAAAGPTETVPKESAEDAAKRGDVKATVAAMKAAGAVNVALWREAVETSRKNGGSQEPDLLLIQAEVSEIRGKPFKEDVPSENQSAEDFGAMVESEIEKEAPKEKRADMTAGLNRLGLLPQTFDMKEEVTGALKSQAAAYYDPKKKKFFNLFSDMPAAMVEATAAHELVHALQDQYHDLDPWFTAHDDSKSLGARDDDRTLALRAVVEGEATYVQTIWQLEHTMHMKPAQAAQAARMSMPMVANMELEDLVKMAKSQGAMLEAGSAMQKALDDMETIQPYVLAPLFSAYMNGAALIGTVGAKGWADVDKLYDEPPTSSEQALHPEKYAKKRDDPTPIALPDMPEIAAAGWREADAARHGEIYFRVLLKRHGVPAKTANKAAAGWDGDLYRAWRAEDGRAAVVLATTWDADGDAKEFFDAYKTALSKKYEKLAPEPGDAPDAFRYVCGEANDTGALWLRGREVFAVEGFPAELRATIVEKLIATKIEHVE